MHVETNDACADEQLQDPASGDDRRESELHESASVGGEDDSHPIEGIAAFRSKHTIDRYLAAYKIDEQRDGSVKNLLLVVDKAIGFIDKGEKFDGWL